MKKLSLRQLSQNELEKREMNHLLGGGTPGTCGCGCVNKSLVTNGAANYNYGYTTPGVPNACMCTITPDNTDSNYDKIH